MSKPALTRQGLPDLSPPPKNQRTAGLVWHSCALESRKKEIPLADGTGFRVIYVCRFCD